MNRWYILFVGAFREDEKHNIRILIIMCVSTFHTAFSPEAQLRPRTRLTAASASRSLSTGCWSSAPPAPLSLTWGRFSLWHPCAWSFSPDMSVHQPGPVRDSTEPPGPVRDSTEPPGPVRDSTEPPSLSETRMFAGLATQLAGSR